MRTNIQPLWEVKEIYQGNQVLRYGFQVATEQEARALYDGSHRYYQDSTLEANRVDGILTKYRRYLLWLQCRKYLDWVVRMFGVLGAGLSVFPSINLDTQIVGVPLNVFAIITLVAVIYTLFVDRYHGPDQQEAMAVLTLTIHHERLSAPPIQRSEP